MSWYENIRFCPGRCSSSIVQQFCCCCWVAQSCVTLCGPMDCSKPGLSVPHHFLKFAQVHVHCISDAVQPSRPLMPSSPFCPQFFPASLTFSMSRLFASGDQINGASASASVLPMNIQGWVPLINWFYLLAVQGTLRSLLQHHSLKASVLWCSAFFMVQLSQLCMTTGNIVALTTWTFVGRVISLLLNTLSRFVITFLPGSNHLLISWLQSPSIVILEP